jgi:hypothetical protein
VNPINAVRETSYQGRMLKYNKRELVNIVDWSALEFHFATPSGWLRKSLARIPRVWDITSPQSFSIKGLRVAQTQGPFLICRLL